MTGFSYIMTAYFTHKYKHSGNSMQKMDRGISKWEQRNFESLKILGFYIGERPMDAETANLLNTRWLLTYKSYLQFILWE